MQWVNNFVHEGTFTVGADRHECCQVVRKALDDKLDRLLLEKKKEQYRFCLAKCQQIAGLPILSRSLNCFMTDFHFESKKSLQQQKGIGPMACAALSGDAQLLVQLLEQKAILETSSLLISEIDMWPGQTPVHFAASAGEAAGGVLAELLRLRADANGARFGARSCLALCRSPLAVELLVQYWGDVNRTSALVGAAPLCELVCRAANVATVAKLIEHKADVNQLGSGAGMPPLSWLAVNLSNPYCTEVAQLLLQSRADINCRVQMGGIFRFLEDFEAICASDLAAASRSGRCLVFGSVREGRVHWRQLFQQRVFHRISDFLPVPKLTLIVPWTWQDMRALADGNSGGCA